MTDETFDDGIEPEEFRRLAAIARSVTLADTRLDEPPAGLWDAIAARLDEEPSDAAGSALSAPGTGGATVTPMALAPSRRRQRFLWPVLAAAAVLVAVIGLVAVLAGDDDTAAVQAATELLSLDGADSELGRAELIESDGRLAVRVDLTDVELPDDGFLELWVIDTDVVGMHSLGIVERSGVFVLPAGLDPQQFPVVDISIEPIDGDPTHSGNSVARGQLRFTS